ncbi:hypothetical protein E7T06_07245 [Deinococcus sp. Arct2-2]|uniref:hypothetical protein n=1 Tax=Deinococcus sp. Arct2-2 TaxID=2568653 RepID=UPI0010A365C9|nr:hypothetical protein [Deinococcus sp. Arct2-2]THF70492.1 hypothetical protein E7T06_07245 [Deinococcus sp. Arct2-2]
MSVRWADLALEVAQLQQGVTVDLTELLHDLWSKAQQEADTSRLLAALETRARRGIFQACDVSARFQHAELRPGVRHPQVLLDTAEQLAILRAKVVRDRAETVILKATQGLVSPYARLAAQVLITDAARTGTTAGGLVGGATHKEFIRIRGAKEPRTHSRYEDTVRPINGTWLIAGIEVDGPGDARLPWSEKAFCGHICRYFRQ